MHSSPSMHVPTLVAGAQGDANDYGPIIYYIRETQRTADVLAKWSM